MTVPSLLPRQACTVSTMTDRFSASTRVKGVVALKRGAPLEVVDVLVPAPGPGEAVVDVQACGVCHSDPSIAQAVGGTAQSACGARRASAATAAVSLMWASVMSMTASASRLR